MASVDVSKLSSQELAELACTYASLILHDDGQDISGTLQCYFIADRIKKLVNASNVKIEAYWPGIFAKALEGHDINSFFSFGASAGSSPAQPAAKEATKEVPKEAPKDDKKGKKPEPKKEEKPVE